jgi:hypothetical protein
MMYEQRRRDYVERIIAKRQRERVTRYPVCGSKVRCRTVHNRGRDLNTVATKLVCDRLTHIP